MTVTIVDIISKNPHYEKEQRLSKTVVHKKKKKVTNAFQNPKARYVIILLLQK